MAFSLILGWNQKKANAMGTDFKVQYETTDKQKVTLKENTSYCNPVFIINKNGKFNSSFAKAESSVNNMRVNYCYCRQLMRYYWVDNIVATTNDIIEIHCHTDVLATWDHAIREYNGYILYTGNKEKRDGRLDDPRLVPDMHVIKSAITMFDDKNPQPFLAGTCYKITVFAWTESVQDTSTVISYFMSPTEFAKLYDYLGQIDSNTPISDILDQFAIKMQSAMYGYQNITDYIQSIDVLPFDISYITSNATNLTTFGPTDEFKIGPFKLKGCTLYAGLDSLGAVGAKDTYMDIDLTFPYGNIVSGAIESEDVYFMRGDKYNSLAFKHPEGILNIPLESFVAARKPVLRVIYSFAPSSGTYSFQFWDKDAGTYLGSAAGQCKWPLRLFEAGGEVGGTMKSIASITNIALGVASFGSRFATGYGGGEVIGESTTTDNSTSHYATSFMQNGELASRTGARNANVSTHSIQYSQSKSLHDTIGIHGSFNYTPAHTCVGGGTFGSNNIALFRSLQGNELGTFSVNNIFSLVFSCTAPRVMVTGQYDDFAAIMGYPCGSVMKINDLKSGYVQCSMASIEQNQFSDEEPAMLTPERQGLNNFLNSGFYLTDNTPEP